MMPKQKAIELVNKYYNYLPQWVNTTDAKLCALIAVDEILKITWVDKFLTVEEYWQEVKQEIQKYEISYEAKG
jgi:hypothetical protein